MHKLLGREKNIKALEDEAEDLRTQLGNETLTKNEAQNRLAHSYGFISSRQMELYVLQQSMEFDDFLYLSCLVYWPSDRPRNRDRARQLLASEPALLERDIYHASATGNLAAATRFIDANPSLANERGGFFDWEPLLYACYSRLNLSSYSTFDVAKLLLERGANADAHYMWGGQYRFTALTGAFGEGEMGPSNQPAHERCEDLAKLLLQHGADPNDGQALYNRMFEPGQSWIQLLLDHGLNHQHTVNWLEEDGNKLVSSEEHILDYQLRWAVEKGHIERARLLIEAGANVTSKNRSGESFSTIAYKRGDIDFAEQLASLGSPRQELPEIEKFIAVCMSGNMNGARALLRKNPNLVDQVQEEFADTVGKAAGEGNLKGLKVFHELGFNLNKMQGQTPLHQAVLGGHVDNVKWLVNVGCDLGVRDDVHGSTPLQWSLALGRTECRELLDQFDLDVFDAILSDRPDRIEELVQSNSSVLETTLKQMRNSENSFEDDWMTPLAFALTRERFKATKCLLKLGANRQLRTPSGTTLDELARQEAPKEIAGLW